MCGRITTDAHVTVEFSKFEVQQIVDALKVLGGYRRRLEHELKLPTPQFDLHEWAATRTNTNT